MINLYRYVYYILSFVLNCLKESMQLLQVTTTFSYLLQVTKTFHQTRSKMFTMFQEGRKTFQATCRYRNLFMHFSSARVTKILFWPQLEHTRWGGSAKKANRTPQFRRGFGKINISLAELESTASMSFFFFFFKNSLFVKGLRCGRVIRSQGYSWSLLLFAL